MVEFSAMRIVLKKGKYVLRKYVTHASGEWPSGSASFRLLAEVKLGCVRSATGQVAFQINDQNNSLRRVSEGTLNYGYHAWMRHIQ